MLLYLLVCGPDVLVVGGGAFLHMGISMGAYAISTKWS